MNLTCLGSSSRKFPALKLSLLLASHSVYVPATSSRYLAPAGISFYTFHSLSYNPDIFESSLQPTRHAHVVLACRACPQLVARPIVRRRAIFFSTIGLGPQPFAHRSVSLGPARTSGWSESCSRRYPFWPVRRSCIWLWPGPLIALAVRARV